MPDEGRVCPKCAYQRKPGEQAPEQECPHCGVIYDKFVASQSRQGTATDRPRKAAAQSRVKKQLPRWMLVALPVLLIAAAVVVLAVAGRSTSGNDRRALGLEDQGVSFNYPLEGTWEGSLRQTYPVTGNTPSYDAEYNATVIVEKGGKVKEVRWTDAHSLNSRREITWRDGDVEVVCLDRRGSILMGKRDIVLDTMEEYLRVQRQGNVLTVSNKCKDSLELEVSIPDAFPRKEVDAGRSPKMVAGQDSAVTLDLPVQVLQSAGWSMPSSRITHLVLSPDNSRETWIVSKQMGKDAGVKGETVYTSMIKDLRLGDGTISLGVMFLKNYIPREGLNPLNYDDKGNIAPDPKNLTLIDGEDIMKLSASPFIRDLRIRFAQDGQVTLEIVGNRLRYNNQFMIYTLKRAG
jgi:hypothetical protein